MYTYIYICVYHHLEVDRIWDFQADIIFLSGSFEISIFYLLQDDYVYMYIYIYS